MESGTVWLGANFWSRSGGPRIWRRCHLATVHFWPDFDLSGDPVAAGPFLLAPYGLAAPAASAAAEGRDAAA